MNKDSRIKNSIRNIIFGLIVTLVNVLVNFVTRTALVKTLGIEILSINGLFNEVISMLSLVELGTGTAIIYSLYKPISENDEKKISQLMGLYRTAYHVIAIALLLVGLVAMPFVHKLVNEVDFPLLYLRIVFILFVIKTASSYLFSYKASLLNADQKQYVVSFVTALARLIFSGIFVGILLLFRNYILYLILLVLESVVTNIVLSIIVDKKYSFIDYKERLSYNERREIFINIKDIFWKRVAGVITYSTDNVLISLLVGTLTVGYYSNYVIIYNVFQSLTGKLTQAVSASIGNLSVTEEAKHNIVVLKRLTFLYFVFAMIVSSGLMCVSKAFVTLWLGEEFVLAEAVVYTTVFILFLDICGGPLWQFLEVSGLFKKDKYIGLFGNVVNMFISVIFGMRIGIVGIFIGTIVAKFIEIILKTLILYRDKLKIKFIDYYFTWIKMIIAYTVLLGIIFFIVRPWEMAGGLIEEFLVKGIISVVLAVSLAIPLFLGSDELKYSFGLIKTIFNKTNS